MDELISVTQGGTRLRYGLFHSPTLLMAVVALNIFIVEIMVMAFISVLPDLPPICIFLLDSTLLLLFIFPCLYIFFLRPLRMHIAQRNEAEEQLRRSLEEMRNLSNHLQTLREEERARIASEIHDELGQSLTALKTELFWLGNRGSTPLSEKCRELCTLTDDLIKTVQRISTELRPSILDNFGLAAAIEWQVENFRKWAGIDSGAVLDFDESKISLDCSTALFRIVQESLTNIARHSGATYARVIIREKDGHVVLKVIDDGDGIPRHKVFALESLGLIGIRERVHSLRGKIRMKGITGKGTGICVTIPLSVIGGDA